MPKTSIRKEKIALMEHQIKDLLDTIQDGRKKHSYRNYLMAATWFSIGFRVSEIANFKIGWIEFGDESDFIHIKQNDYPYAFKPKYGSTRRIAIPKKLSKKLKSYLGGRTTGYVFKPQSKNINAKFHKKALINMCNKYMRETSSIGRNLGSHTFRRTFASQLANANPPVPITKISYYLGHRNLQSTIVYLKNIKTDDHSALLNTDYIKSLYEN